MCTLKMATASQPTLFNQAVSRILSSWAAFQIAVEHGFGGSNSRQKAQNLENDIVDMFQRKGKIDPYDFTDFLEDELDDKFDLLLEDGSAQMIAHHICQSFALLRDGHVTEVGQFLEHLPNTAQHRVQFAGGADSSDEDDEGEDTGCPSSDPQLHQPHQQQQQNGEGSGESVGTADQSPMASGAGGVGMDVDEEDGWTVVKKGGKRR